MIELDGSFGDGPMGLAASQGSPCVFRTQTLSGHSRTHLEVLRRFLPICPAVEDQPDGTVIVRMEPADD